MTAWDPDHYEEFFAERLRPGRDLMARVETSPGSIVDLGCGTGRLTAELAIRWPDASVLGIDRSVDMIAAAPPTTAVFELGDIETWVTQEPVGLLYANASLQWVPDHPGLFNRLFSMLVRGGVLAVQMPLSWDQPSHRILREVGSEHGVEIGSPPTLDADAYLDILSEAPAGADVWVTTYHHVLTGDNPVFRWVSATDMKRFLDQIDPGGRPSYLNECAQRMAAAYPPPGRNGETVFPFTRLFMLARARN